MVLHIFISEDLYTQLGTNPDIGLTSTKAAEVLAYYGPNTLTPTSQYGWTRVLFKSLCTGEFQVIIYLIGGIYVRSGRYLPTRWKIGVTVILPPVPHLLLTSPDRYERRWSLTPHVMM